MAGCLVLSGVAALVALLAVIRGWVLTYLWHWFVTPTFGLPELGVVEAIGVSLVVSFLTHEHSSLVIKDEYKDSAQALITGLMLPFIALAIGFTVSLFM